MMTIAIESAALYSLFAVLFLITYVVEELSSRLVDRKVGLKSGIWGARVKQKVNEWSQK
jgi:hypothetical protein